MAIPTDLRLKIKESEKIRKHSNLPMELKKKLLNIRVSVILIVVVSLGTAVKGLEKRNRTAEIGGGINTTELF